MQKIKSIITAHFGDLPETELNQFASYFYEEKLTKNDLFTEINHTCNRLSIIESGYLRIFASVDGKEITQWISTPNFFVTEISSFFFEQKSRWEIQALNEVHLITINKSNYEKLCNEIPKWNQIEKKFITKCFSMLEDRVFSHLSMSAAERYEAFYNSNKELFNQVPLQYIASILGMTPETFSRIRKRHLLNS